MKRAHFAGPSFSTVSFVLAIVQETCEIQALVRVLGCFFSLPGSNCLWILGHCLPARTLLNKFDLDKNSLQKRGLDACLGEREIS